MNLRRSDAHRTLLKARKHTIEVFLQAADAPFRRLQLRFQPGDQRLKRTTMSHNGCHLLLSAFKLLAQLSNFCLEAIPPSARRTKVVFQLPFPALQNATLLNDLRMALPRALKVVVQIVLHAIKACGSGPRFDQLVLEIADMILHGIAASRETIRSNSARANRAFTFESEFSSRLVVSVICSNSISTCAR